MTEEVPKSAAPPSWETAVKQINERLDSIEAGIAENNRIFARTLDQLDEARIFAIDKALRPRPAFRAELTEEQESQRAPTVPPPRPQSTLPPAEPWPTLPDDRKTDPEGGNK